MTPGSFFKAIEDKEHEVRTICVTVASAHRTQKQEVARRSLTIEVSYIHPQSFDKTLQIGIDLCGKAPEDFSADAIQEIKALARKTIEDDIKKQHTLSFEAIPMEATWVERTGLSPAEERFIRSLVRHQLNRDYKQHQRK